MARILIVEDEQLVAMMLSDWLIEMEHEPVGPVGTVARALKLLKAGGVDAAILDVNLRGERSDSVAEAVAALGLPIAFATGGSADTIDQRFAASPTLSKPYSFEDMQALVAGLVNNRQRDLASVAAQPASS